MWQVKVGSLSLTMEVGKLYRKTIPLKKVQAIKATKYGWLRVMNCAYMEK